MKGGSHTGEIPNETRDCHEARNKVSVFGTTKGWNEDLFGRDRLSPEKKEHRTSLGRIRKKEVLSQSKARGGNEGGRTIGQRIPEVNS